MSTALDRSRVVAVIGSGAMGAGIAQIAATAGHEVKMFDLRPGAADEAAVELRRTLLKLAPADAFGTRDESLTQTVARASLPGTPKVGAQFRGQTGTSQSDVVFRITGFKGDNAMMDGNHPLAGRAVQFDLTVTDIRAASEEEIAHRHVHGAHGHHH